MFVKTVVHLLGEHELFFVELEEYLQVQIVRLVLFDLLLTGVAREGVVLLPTTDVVRLIAKDRSAGHHLIAVLSLLVLHCNTSCLSLSSGFVLLPLELLFHKGLNLVETSVLLLFLVVSVELVGLLLETLEIVCNVRFSKLLFHLEELFAGLLLMIEYLAISGAHAQIFFSIFCHVGLIAVLQVDGLELPTSILFLRVHYN